LIATDVAPRSAFTSLAQAIVGMAGKGRAMVTHTVSCACGTAPRALIKKQLKPKINAFL
jgi:hypothetical protein